MKRIKVAIVGCGVAGSVLGASLARMAGVELMCFEKASLADHGDAGTGLNVGPNAIATLQQLDPALAQAVVKASEPWARWTCQDTAGRVIFDFPMSDCADRPGIRIRWSELYRVLRAPLAEHAHFGAEVLEVAADPARPGSFFIEWRDALGTLRRDEGFDLVVATDGRYSALRPRFAGAWTPRHVACTIFRLLVPDTSAGLVDDYAWWFNGHRRLLAFRVPPGHVYIAGSFGLPAAGTAIPEEDKRPEAMARHYFPADAEPCPQVRWMVDQLAAHHASIHWARLQETPPLFRAPGGQVLFLGDSAHGMVPTLGQGATQAVEDACAAAWLIGDALQDGEGPVSPAEVAALTETISQARLPRIQWVMDLSLDATRAMLAGGEPVRDMGRFASPEGQASLSRLWAGLAPDRILQGVAA